MRLPIEEVVGNNVLRLRKKRGWSQRELAQKTGVSQRVISNIEQGGGAGSSSIKILDSIARGLGVPAYMMLMDSIDTEENRIANLSAAVTAFSTLLDKNQDRVLEIMNDYSRIEI